MKAECTCGWHTREGDPGSVRRAAQRHLASNKRDSKKHFIEMKGGKSE